MRLDTEPLHAADECRTLQTKPCCSTIGSSDAPVRLPQRAEDHIALGVIQFVAKSSQRKRLDSAVCPAHRRFASVHVGDVDFEDRTGREDDRALNDVLELPDVARPGVPAQISHGRAGNGLERFVHAPRKLAREGPDQKRNVLRPVSKRGDPDGKDVQTVEEIGPEHPPLDHRSQVAVRRRDHPDVGTQGARAAQTLEFPFLKHPEKLRLQLERELADFVEEDGSAIRQLETSDALSGGARERSLLVPEELAFQKTAGNR